MKVDHKTQSIDPQVRFAMKLVKHLGEYGAAKACMRNNWYGMLVTIKELKRQPQSAQF